MTWLRSLFCLVVLVSPAWTATLAQAGDRIYWANNNAQTISFANLDGSGGGNVDTTGASVDNSFGVALDAANGRIYWADQGGSKISFANLDGSGGAGVLNTTGATVSGPAGVALDPAAGRIWWANGNVSKISFANLDGSGGGDLDTTGATVSIPQGVALDPVAQRIWWANAGGNKISFAALNGSGGGDLPVAGATVNTPIGVAIDRVGGRVWWANYGGNKISSANLDGSGGADLTTTGASVSGPAGPVIDRAAGRVWWTNDTANKISFANLDGSGGGDLTTSGATVNQPFLAALLKTPVGAGAPAITGESEPGAALSCSSGSWAPDLLDSFLYRAPQRFAFQWSLDGTDIAGADSSSLTPSSPGEYRCRVTASNAAGDASQTSAPHTLVTSPPVTADITDYTINPSSFRAATRGPAVQPAQRRRRGATVSFQLNVAASVAFRVRQRRGGRRDPRGRCVKRTRKNRSRRRCARFVTLRGGFTRAGTAGDNGFRFMGRVRGRTLRPGRYRLAATPTAGGSSGPVRNVSFRIRRPQRRQ